jgi:hypothetical protein
MKSLSASVLILTSFLVCGAANADTLISNLGATSFGNIGISSYYGQSFTTGSSSLGYLLSDITTYSSGTSLAQGGGTIYLYSSAYTGIASNLGTGTDFICSAYCSSTSASTWSFSDITLLADHTYYFYVDPEEAAKPGYANGYSGGMYYMALSSSNSFTNYVAATDYAFTVSGTEVAVPEPATVAGLAGLAALGFAAMKRRKR